MCGHHYFLTFIDDAGGCTWVYLIKSKDEVLDTFKNYHRMAETKFGRKIKMFRSDIGGKYTSKEFQIYLLDIGIERQTSCAYTLEQNGVAEHKNRHLLEVARALLIGMNVPKSFWSDGVMTAAFLINRMASRVLGEKSHVDMLSPSIPLFPIVPKVFSVHLLCSYPKTTTIQA